MRWLGPWVATLVICATAAQGQALYLTDIEARKHCSGGRVVAVSRQLGTYGLPGAPPQAPVPGARRPSIAQPYFDQANGLRNQARALAQAGEGNQAAALLDRSYGVQQAGLDRLRAAELAAMEAYRRDPILGEAMAAQGGFEIPAQMKAAQANDRLFMCEADAVRAGFQKSR